MVWQSFHQELSEIPEAVMQLTSLVETASARAMQALTHRDVLLAATVRTSDGTINALQRTIRNRCISVMARLAPVAGYQRELITVQLGPPPLQLARPVASRNAYSRLASLRQVREGCAPSTRSTSCAQPARSLHSPAN